VKTPEPNSHHERQGKRRDAPDECMGFDRAAEQVGAASGGSEPLALLQRL
jgi:hypothetical protein